MPTGFIKKLDQEKGYGFIAEANGPDRFFHCSALIDLAFDDQLLHRQVRYDLVDDVRSGKVRAANVRAE